MMKTIFSKFKHSILLGVSCLVLSLSSCDGFFQAPITESLNQDSIFNTMYNADRALSAAYYLIPFNWSWSYNSIGYQNATKMCQDVTATICDEAVTSAGWTGAFKAYYGDGTISPLTVGHEIGGNGDNNKKYVEHIYEEPYYFFRRTYVFLENVHRVGDATPEWTASTTGQAKLLIAIGYYELFKRYGSVPFVDKALSSNDDLNIPRLPLKDFVQKIDDLIADAIPGLPDNFPQTDPGFGRVTKGVAYFLRSRLWLTAASPLFNTNQPYLDMPNPSDNNLICLGNAEGSAEHKAVWEKAVKYTKEAIDYCDGQYAMMMPSDMTDLQGVSDNYHEATRDLSDNTEIICFSRRVANSTGSGKANTFIGRNMPPRASANGKAGQSAYCTPTQNFVDMYNTLDGSTPDYNTANPWVNLDPRFHATVIHDQSDFGGITIGTATGDPWIMSGKETTGYYLKKFFHADQYVNYAVKKDMPYIYMRLPELYLNYAEALNETNPGDAEIENYLNKTVERAAMPRVLLGGKGQDEVRELIRKERAVELAMEDHRFFDVKRWMIAPTTIGAVKRGVERVGKADGNQTYRIQDVKATCQTNWHDKYYLMPFPQYEILKGKGLIQNPGY